MEAEVKTDKVKQDWNQLIDDAAKKYVESHKDGEVRRMYGHHYRSFQDGAKWENERNKAFHYELLEALKDLTAQVEKDCSIGSDPKFLEMLYKVQKAKEQISKAEQ